MRSSICGNITINGSWWLLYGAALLFVPLKWILGWVLAALIHELGHFAAMKLLQIDIRAFKISAFGACIVAGPATPLKEFICALSGPLAGLSTLFFMRNFPYIALSAAVQSIFNLIPVYPLDGGRAFRSILAAILPEETICRVITYTGTVVIGIFLLLGTCLSINYKLGIVPVLFPSLPILVSAVKNSLQTVQKKSTIQRRTKWRGKR